MTTSSRKLAAASLAIILASICAADAAVFAKSRSSFSSRSSWSRSSSTPKRVAPAAKSESPAPAPKAKTDPAASKPAQKKPVVQPSRTTTTHTTTVVRESPSFFHSILQTIGIIAIWDWFFGKDEPAATSAATGSTATGAIMHAVQ